MKLAGSASDGTARRSRVCALAAALLLATTTSAHEQVRKAEGDIVARLEVDRAHVRLDEEIKLTLRLEGPAPLKVQRIEAVILSGEWTMRETPPRTERTGPGRERWQQTFTLSPLRAPGPDRLVVLPLRYGAEGRIDWDPIDVTVTTDLTDPSLADAKDISSIEQVSPPDRTWQLWALGIGSALAIFAVLAVAVWLVRRRRLAPAPPPTAEQWAIDELARLEAAGFAEPGSERRHLTRLADIVRCYLELRFDLPASERTTRDIVAAIAPSSQLAPPLKEQLRELLERCDLAKFANASFSLQECTASAQAARDFVQLTTPVKEGSVAGERTYAAEPQ